MPEEKMQLSDKEKDAIQRLADAKKQPFDEVLEFVAVNALMEYPRGDDQKGKNP